MYELGLKVGPGFFSSFRKGGITLNLLGLGVILIGTFMTILVSTLGGIPMSFDGDIDASSFIVILYMPGL